MLPFAYNKVRLFEKESGMKKSVSIMFALLILITGSSIFGQGQSPEKLASGNREIGDGDGVDDKVIPAGDKPWERAVRSPHINVGSTYLRNGSGEFGETVHRDKRVQAAERPYEVNHRMTM